MKCFPHLLERHLRIDLRIRLHYSRLLSLVRVACSHASRHRSKLLTDQASLSLSSFLDRVICLSRTGRHRFRPNSKYACLGHVSGHDAIRPQICLRRRTSSLPSQRQLPSQTLLRICFHLLKLESQFHASCHYPRGLRKSLLLCILFSPGHSLCH